MIGWINERLTTGDYNLIHTRTQHMSADIYTKYFSNPETWQRLLMLINVYTPEQLAAGVFNPINSPTVVFVSLRTQSDAI